MELVSPLMALVISSEPSLISVTVISGGSVFLISFIFLFTARAIATVLAPVCLEIISLAPSCPLIFSSNERSLMVSRTVARSRTKICLPVGVVATTMSAISELSSYSPFTRIWYCSLPILTVPEARSRLFALMACPTASTLNP